MSVVKKWSKKYDAYYDPDTLEWLEKKCSDKDCEYCAARPDKAPDYTTPPKEHE